MHNLSDLQNVSFPLFEGDGSFLSVFEGAKNVPFDIARIFVVKATDSVNRGNHAHKKCAQLLVALHGECTVLCDDGVSQQEVILNKPSQGLLIPPTIWASQDYKSDSILMVLADQPYDEEDYLRDYQDFLKFRGQQ